jgi:glycosyltransferase involved in cell wall biosynthesis
VESVIPCEPLEVILINDASTDGTLEICEKLSCKYQNIRIINHTENGGSVKSRNDGLQISKGDYIAYIDADDWINSEFFSFAQAEFEKDESVDIVVGKMCMDNANGLVRPVGTSNEYRKLEHTTALRELFYWNYYRWECCGKVYKKELFNGWKTDDCIRVCEDLDCTWELFGGSRRTVYLPVDYYHYFFNEESMTHNCDYLTRNEYKVFEKILKNPAELDEKSLNIVIQNYKNSLINIIRDGILYKNDDKLVQTFQDKYGRLKEDFQLTDDENDKELFTSPDSVRYVLGKIRTQLHEVCERCGNENIFLYGTGNIAAFFTELLKRESVEITGYVVSNGQYKRSIFCDKKVYYLMDIPLDSALVMAVNEKLQDLIIEDLNKRGYRNVHRIACYGIGM